ncbi:MAG: MFS transporter [Actinomycetes bacterium]
MSLDLRSVQRRTVGVLSATQVLSGVGVASGVAAGSLLVADVTGSEGWAGLAQTSGVLGAAAAAVPLAAVSNRRGRRPGLSLGLLTGGVGAVVVIVAGTLELLPLILAGTFLVGSATAAGLQSRYAATDLADPDRVARSLSLVVWATTVGAVLGPNLMQPASQLADRIGLPPLTGPYVVTATALCAGALVITIGLRPDPLMTERATRGVEDVPPRATLAEVRDALRTAPGAVLGLTAIAIGHAVMVMVMVMTPVHMQHVEVTLTVIGLVISVHILGMYALSPVVGWLADRYGAARGIAVGTAILFVSTVVAGTAPGDNVLQLGAGLFLLGLGWSFTLVCGSALITESVADVDRPGIQGAGDTVMNLAGALAGVVAGIVVATASYGWLNVVAAVALVPLVVQQVRLRRRVAPGPGGGPAQ